MRKTAMFGLSILLIVGRTAAAQSVSSGQAVPGTFRFGVEGLDWWFKGSPIPVPIASDGSLGEPESKVLLGGRDLKTNPNWGMRFTTGYTLSERLGFEGNFFYVFPHSTSKGVSSSGAKGSTDLLVPYFDVLKNKESTSEITLSPLFGGGIEEELRNSLLGAEVNATWALSSDRSSQVSVLGGVRWLRLREKYTIRTISEFIPPQPADVWRTTDEFDTRNSFYGGQVGVRASCERGALSATATVKVAVGAMVQKVDIDGFLVTNDFTNFGPTQTFAGGIFALPTNIGRHKRTVFGVVPEVGVNADLRITSRVSIVGGYSLLYANAVARPGNQVDRNINPTQSVSWTGEPPATLVGPARPSSKFESSSFWAQGLNLGLAVRF
jgi:hypothetical protein